MGIEVNVGDVFLVPLDDKSWALGQIISDYEGELYVAIFSEKQETQKVDPDSVIGQKPTFLALTLDAKLFHGDWPILGNMQDNLADFPQPNFKVRQSGVVHIESRDRSVSRQATPAEAEILGYRSVSSPAVIENAVKAHFGIGDWTTHYNEFQADYAYRSARLL
ncbi:MAG: Imm26 family immunity protein [Erythrobacter sp.]|uniref:Imm26 family immunity protein n=1 Tax=Erythrobacter sp. TaxID=1042 RepID=UPI003297A911